MRLSLIIAFIFLANILIAQENPITKELWKIIFDNNHKELSLLIKNNSNQLSSVEMDTLKNNMGQTPLTYSSYKGYSKIVDVLLNSNISPNSSDSNGNTALIEASKMGHFDIVKALYKSKANINKLNDNGYPAILYAARNNHIKIIKFLCKHGATLNFSINKKTSFKNEMVNEYSKEINNSLKSCKQ